MMQAIAPGQHVMTLRAYERRADLGGGFRGVALDRRTGEKRESDVLPTLAEARDWAKRQAFSAFPGQAFGFAPMPCRGEYFANVWLRATA